MTADSPEDFLASLGEAHRAEDGVDPFSPPEDFEHGPEFSDETPRSLPDFAGRSRYVRARQATVWSLLLLGFLCWVTEKLPFVQTLSWYVLPLGYLTWLAVGFLLLAAYYWVRNMTSPGFLAYLRRGSPLIGRIRRVDVRQAGTNEAPEGRFEAEVEFRHPATGQMHHVVVVAPETFRLQGTSEMDPGVAAGDYVTLVYLPDRLENSLQLYGWLGVHPDLDLIRSAGLPLRYLSPWTALLLVGAGMGALWATLAFFYVMELYRPLNNDLWWPYTIGIGLATIPFAIVLLRGVDRHGASLGSLLKSYAVAGFCSLLGGAIVGYTVVGFLNGYFDRSPAHLEPVRIVQLWQKTYDFVWRTYELEYQPLPAGKSEKKTVSVGTLASFDSNSLGAMDVGSGWLGMRWIRDFHPVKWVTVNADDEEVSPGEIRFQVPDEPLPMRIVPRIVIVGSPPTAPPEALLPELRARMISYLTNELQATVRDADQR